MPRFTNTTTTSIAGGSNNLMTAIPLDVIQTNILNRLDGVTLASTSCASSQLLSLQIRLLGPRETVPTPLKSDGDDSSCMSLAEEHLRVSWIVIDPNKKRAVNIASHKAVDSLMLRFTGGINLRYATVAALATGKLVQFSVVATCDWMRRELHVIDVHMQIMGVERIIHDGRESMRILQAAMEGRRRRIDYKTEKDNYKKFMRRVEQYALVMGFTLFIVLLIVSGILLYVVYTL